MKYFKAVINNDKENFENNETGKNYNTIKEIFKECYQPDQYSFIEELDPAKIQNLISQIHAALTDFFYPAEVDAYDIETAFNEWLKKDSTDGVTVYYDNTTIVYLPEGYESDANAYIENFISEKM